MKYLHVILRSLLRNRRRTLLTILSLAVSVFLVAVLQGILATMDGFAHNPDSANRIAVRHKISIANFLPLRDRDWIRQQPEVEAVMALQWFGGVYQDQRNFFPNFAVDPEPLAVMFKEEIKEHSEAEFRDFIRDRTGCIVGRALAEKFGWRVGDVVPLQGTIFPVNPRLTIRGIFRGKRPPDEMVLYFQYKHLEESVSWIGGKVGAFWVRSRNADDVPKLIERIDHHFQESLEPTTSETENAFQMEFLKMLGDYGTMIHTITGAVLAAIVVVTASTMAMTIRERTTEIAVFRAMGFTGRQVLGLLMAEGLLLAAMGGLLGIGLALAAAGALRGTVGLSIPWLNDFQLKPETLLFCLQATLGVGALSTFIPAYQAIRRPIVDGLRAL
jgi:putative ABC transport system permease protein